MITINNINDKIILAKLLFPYSFKNDQEKMLGELIQNTHVLWSAPTGYGKTIISIISCLIDLIGPYSTINKIIVAVRTKTQIFRILEECGRISEKYFKIYDELVQNTEDSQVYPLDIFAIPLIGKNELCINPNKPVSATVDCEGLKCNLYKIDMPNNNQIVQLINDFSFSELKSTTKIKEFLINETPASCPYYILKSMINNCQIIVTTHSYIINNNLREGMFNEFGINPTKTAIIIDEVHNFQSRITGKISFEQIQNVENLLYSYNLPGKEYLTNIRSIFQNKPLSPTRPLIDANNAWRINELKNDIEYLKNNKLRFINENFRNSIITLNKLCEFLDNDGELWYFDVEEDNNTKKLQKILYRMMAFPSDIFVSLKKFSKIILMSGTLYPAKAYLKLFGLTEHFDNNLFVLIEVIRQKQLIFYANYLEQYLSSRYINRSLLLYYTQIKLIQTLHEINIKGHTVIFSTSHEYTNVLTKIMKKIDEKNNLYQIYTEGNSAENQLLLNQMRMYEHCMLFATLNSTLSEGVEIIDPISKRSKIRLIIITGIPETPPSSKLEYLFALYFDRFDRKRNEINNTQGDTTYSTLFLKWLPIYQSILQACGRGIRSPTDHCAIVCLDYRLTDLNIFPSNILLSTNDWNLIVNRLKEFYSEQE